MLPALYPFDSQDRWITYAEKYLIRSDQDREATLALVARKLIPVLRGPEIALFLGVSPKLISHMVIRSAKYYRSFQIPKRNGDMRTITAPRVFLKTVQRYILDCILSLIPISEKACGFRRGYNCRSGASLHVGMKFLWNLDLQDFFPSLTKRMVRSTFVEIGYPEEAAYFLAGLCCLNEHLPQGAPTSPALSNIIFRPVDDLLAEASVRGHITYSRYADDLSFSSKTPISETFQDEVKTILRKAGYRIQQRKSRFMGPAIRREVTGLSVNVRVSIPRNKRRQLRAFFHRIALNPAEHIHQKAHAMGFAAWVKDYHPLEGKRYLEVAKSIPDRPDT